MQQQNLPPLVLLVEDSEDLREVLEAFLEARNYRVVAQEDVQGAIDAMHAERPDLVLTDIFLGQSSGLDLITAIRSDFSTPPPIIACSGMPEIEGPALARGADLFLPKPLVPDTLTQAMAALLGAHAPSRELLEENANRSRALRAEHVEAAREVMAKLEPQRAMVERQADRDARWLPAFLGWGSVILALIEGERLTVTASSDPRRWPKGSEIERDLPLCRHVLETGSTFLVPDVGALMPQAAAVVGPRFVACFPFRYGDTPIGVACLVDDRPCSLDPADFALIEELCAHFSEWLSNDERPRSRGAELMHRHSLEMVVRNEFDRAARNGLTVHCFAFASRTRPSDMFAERTLIAELGEGRFGLIMTRGSSERSPPELVTTIRRLRDLPGFGGGDLLSIEVDAAPRMGEYVLRLADQRLDERAKRGVPPSVERVVVRHDSLDEAS